MPKSASRMFAGKSVNNHKKALKTKITVRDRILQEIGEASVFDAFAGSGKMYREVWHRAQAYVGCDLRWYPDQREAYVCDNTRLLRALDLQRFNLFDLDAYGSPYTQLAIIAARRRLAAGDRVGLVLTDGLFNRLKFGALPLGLAKLAGVDRSARGANRLIHRLRRRAIEQVASSMGGAVELWFEGEGKTSAKVAYIGIVLRGAQ